jgi:hypothetical protein
VAAVLVALHPGLVYYDTHKLHPLGVDAALAAASVLAVIWLGQRRSAGSALLAGGLHGLAFFERSTYASLLPLALLSLWRSRAPRTFMQHVLCYLIAAAAVLAPWVIRNLQIYRQPVLISTTSAEVFWMGNHPGATGGAVRGGPTPWARTELERSRFFREEARAFIRSYPLDALKLYARKLGIFLWFGPASGANYPAGYLRLYAVYYAVILGLGLIGLIAAWRESAAQRWERLSVAAFIGSVALAQSVFYVEGRHRWGIEPLLLIYSAAGVMCVRRALRRATSTSMV